jgi:hypothetical protein
MNMNETLHAEQPTNTTILNYPGFQSLPKGLRQMLLVSEAYFFNEPAPHRQERQCVSDQAAHSLNDLMGIPLLNAGFAMEV